MSYRIRYLLVGIILFFSESSAQAFPVLFSQDDLQPLLRSRQVLELKFNNNERLINSYAAEIAELQSRRAEATPDTYEEDDSIIIQREADKEAGSGNSWNNCLNQLQSHQGSSGWLNPFQEALAGTSTALTILGPCYEYFHNFKLYARTAAVIPGSAYGWPVFDFITNGLFVVGLGVGYAENGNFWDFFWNAFPSLLVMAIEIGMVATLAIFSCKRRIAERMPLLSPVNYQ